MITRSRSAARSISRSVAGEARAAAEKISTTTVLAVIAVLISSVHDFPPMILRGAIQHGTPCFSKALQAWAATTLSFVEWLIKTSAGIPVYAPLPAPAFG